MSDETFDVVVIGGGTKALFLSMYLTKYAGMSVGIFERRHEIGGALATEELLTFWQRFAPNMTWDNIIGVDTNSPIDHTRLKNMAPNGNMTSIDHVPYQWADLRPTPELANHRTPIKDFYATGAAWHSGANSGSSEAYNCYKIIAKDMGLPKPWEEPGKEEPDSFAEQWKIINQKIKEIPRRET